MQEHYADLMRPWHEPILDFELPPAIEVPPEFDHVTHRNSLSKAYDEMTLALQSQLLAHIHAEHFDFFENLVLDVAMALGFVGRRRDLARKLGRSGDGGVDGVIELDELSLDVVYLQAKRVKPSSSIGAGAVRDFIGSLDTHRATKGIFFTTGSFTQSAIKTIEIASKRIVLVDGKKLTTIMLRHSIGTKVVATFQFKELDLTYFKQYRQNPCSKASAPSR